ncbi:NAD-dependent epimerase/dehydratase family protein [Candidatus Parcubacteria bacterium]|nr:NAD-dependent epimerase/dehydratase family protein [Patescibacteria group bacterium]MBU4309261.1 NAD-dependent epimerase/dehydratase family protein [Patescibacteria group bacterium]MBU4432490.1 NAD-dependent epimerase/dehydratase family protein [Patescibacteria group bacterium]MBU4577622.1 NAD-dependent epimerase/dehydratase family protein [Patescibacteria group bacterium]MCG2697308.1 NAD-dependent epimerase/dehydratase family protein [Candidatus Parcubacteria bacterium]
MKKRIKSVVTGGAGFIGSTLVDRLIELGHEVIVIDNLYSGMRSYVNETAKFYEVNICDEVKIKDIFDKESEDGGIDFVFHLAAQIDVRLSVKDPVFDNKVNVLGSLNILDNAYSHGVKKVMFSSTGGALYGGAEEIPTLETYPTYPFSPYGIHKLTFEKYLSYYYKIYGQNYTSLRFSNVYGPRQYKGGEAGVVSIFIDNAVNSKTSFINGDGLQTRDYVYVDDVVNAFVTAAESDYVGEINFSTGIENNLLDIIAAIEKALGQDVSKEFKVAMPGEERRSCLDYSKANKILNWQPMIYLEEGIGRTIEWTKSLKK